MCASGRLRWQPRGLQGRVKADGRALMAERRPTASATFSQLGHTA